MTAVTNEQKMSGKKSQSNVLKWTLTGRNYEGLKKPHEREEGDETRGIMTASSFLTVVGLMAACIYLYIQTRT